MIDTIRKQYDELRAKISELEVEKWTKVVDAESKYTALKIMADLTYHSIVQRASREDATADIRVLKDLMNGLNRPIVQMSDQISMFQDKFNSRFSFTNLFGPTMLNFGRRRADKSIPLDVHNRV